MKESASIRAKAPARETMMWEIGLILCALCVGYTYVGYPLLVAVWAALRGRPVQKGAFRGTYSVILAAHNEEANIGPRLEELRRLTVDGEILVALDGCTDRSADIARASGVTVLEYPEKRGKAAALTEAAAGASGDVLIFADARQRWADDAIPQLLGNFADNDIGAVSGDLQLESAPGVLAGVGLYWRFEKWLRRRESCVHSQVGVTGAISAVRRELFPGVPAGTILDDVYWPLRVAMAGHRVVHDDAARAFDRLPDSPAKEFRRKVRTLAGNFQLLALVPASLLPWRNPVWLAWVSHKLMRLVAPWALIGLVLFPLLIGEPWAWALAAAQGVCYLIAVLGLAGAVKGRLFGAAGSFLVLNAAAWLAFWVWALGRTGSTWGKTEYKREVTVG